jgi:hypothetical protein
MASIHTDHLLAYCSLSQVFIGKQDDGTSAALSENRTPTGMRPTRGGLIRHK